MEHFSNGAILKSNISQMEHFSNEAILKSNISQMEHFSNGAILKSNISQMEQFSNGAFWGRHHQLDDSLVGQLTRLDVIHRENIIVQEAGLLMLSPPTLPLTSRITMRPR